ncbi:MAG: beta-ketoacyl synthase N-terminal-like domain-containing protein, partial [Pseudomonadota bacterium]
MTTQNEVSQTLAALEQWVTAHLVEVTGVSADKWSSDALFEDIGLESLAITAFTARISPTFPGLRKTFLFECRCVADVCGYLQKSFPDQVCDIANATASTGAPGGDQPNQSRALDIPAPPPHSQSPLSEAAVADVPNVPSVSNVPNVDVPDLQSDLDVWPQIEIHSTHEQPKTSKAEVRTGQEPIAIIGMDGVFPGSQDLQDFWRHIESGDDLIGEIPADRWPLDGFFEAGTSSRTTGLSYAKWGSFLDDVDTFDSQFFGISPKEAKLMDPQERVFLQCAYHAMEDAALLGARGQELDGDVGVFVGITTNTNQLHGPEHWRRGEAEIPTAMPWSAANRVSYYLNLSGPSLAVDTACSSSLVAIHLAVESLLRGECRAAITGGVNLYLHPAKYIQLCQQQMLSPTGRCHSFGERADGFVPGEGAGAVVLKPLSAALEDGDRIRGLIVGSATNHSGRTNGYTVPSSTSQVRLIEKAMAAGALSGPQINYVEAHGTGTKLGDPIEIAALYDALSADPSEQPCAVGSVKSNIGHLESAAGVAGLIKVILQMEQQRIAPSLHSKTLSSQLQIEGTRFHVPQAVQDWPAGPDGKRRAGLSSFGAGGTCAHVIAENYDAPPSAHLPKNTFVFPVSAATTEQLKDLLISLRDTVALWADKDRSAMNDLASSAFT